MHEPQCKSTYARVRAQAVDRLDGTAELRLGIRAAPAGFGFARRLRFCLCGNVMYESQCELTCARVNDQPQNEACHQSLLVSTSTTGIAIKTMAGVAPLVTYVYLSAWVLILHIYISVRARFAFVAALVAWTALFLTH